MEQNEIKSNINLNKIFIYFLIIHTIIWSLLPLIRQVLPIDAMECIYWGGLFDMGTNKHPPLAGWLAYFVYNLFGETDFSIYLLGQVSIITGFIYLYKLGKIFLTKTQSILAVMLMEACFAYTYMGIYDGFNPNFLLLAFLPIITYYSYKSVHDENILNWVKLGLFVGLSFLAKYQTLMLFIPLLLYMIISNVGRIQFKKKGFYIAAFIAFLIVLPHMLWLFKHEFFSINYFVACEERYATFYHGPFKYIWSPFIFLINQIAAIAGTVFIYFTALLFSKEKINKESNNPDDKIFLICAGIAPIFLQSLNGLNGNYMIPQWGYSLLFMTGILLFYFFPFKISDRTAKYMLSWVFTAIFITFIVLFIVFTTEKNFANRFPAKQLSNTLENIYQKETKQPMKYIGGFIELTIPLSLYNNNKYIVILNTYKYPNPWINIDDVKNSGVIILGRYTDTVEKYIEEMNIDIKIKPEIKPFQFTVKNVIGKERVYNMFYAIIKKNNL